MEVREINISEIFADDDFNCRGAIAPIDVVDLAKDIEVNGLMQPVVVMPLLEGDKGYAEGFRYQLVAGYRRAKAHAVLQRTSIPCTIKEHLSEADARFLNLSENIQRKDLNILQEAKAIQKIKDLGVSETECGERLNQSRGWAQVRYMLLDLPPEIQDEVANKVFTQTQIRDLYSILNKYGVKECMEAAKTMKEQKATGKRTVSVNPDKKKTDAKRHRKRPEIFNMQEIIQKPLGNNLATRALAWAAGEITTHELFVNIRETAAEEGVSFIIPEEF
jgi:ParB family chromosome partitioning protein